jgi:hypothetical protein
MSPTASASYFYDPLTMVLEHPNFQLNMQLNPMNLNNHPRLNESERDQEIQANSGVIEIGGVIYERPRVRVEDLIQIGELGSGTCGTVTKRRFHNHSMAVKVRLFSISFDVFTGTPKHR